MTRILVTGASGFIGRLAAAAAAERGYEVVALVRDAQAYRLPDHPVIVAEGDVRDPAAVRSALDGCAAALHIAGMYSFDPADAALMREVNVGGTRNVLRQALDAGVERVVYTGTVGGSAFFRDRLPTESDLAGPDAMRGAYKRSKFEAERVVRRMAAQGAPVVTVCPTAPIGPGDEKPTPTGKIVLDFLRRKLPAYVDTGLNFVHARDVAEGHLLALERGVVGARYLLGNCDGNLTLAEAFRILADVSGVDAPRVRVPHAAALAAARASAAVAVALRRPPPIPPEAARMAANRMWADPSRSVRELGLPQTPVRQAFAEAVEWFVRRGRV